MYYACARYPSGTGRDGSEKATLSVTQSGNGYKRYKDIHKLN